jgi:hypothetical protein
MEMLKSNMRNMVGIAVAASLVSAVSISSAFAAPPADDAEAQAREAWRETIVSTPVPEEACFHASYPSTQWIKVECSTAPNHPYVPRSAVIKHTVGDGDDYVAAVSGLMSKSVGSFPTVTGVTSETGLLGANDYSLQLNSNFMVTAACNGISSCLSWEQFVYSSGYEEAFMQYWLIDYGKKCPGGWNSYEGSCYRNSAAVSVPLEAITELETLRLSGSAKLNGKDTLVFTADTEAYSTTGKDSVVDLATAWQESEFNVIGDGDGSAAVFNKGSKIKVKIQVTDGSTSSPACVADGGTTGETNNLNLKSCTVAGGAKPSMEFTESN